MNESEKGLLLADLNKIFELFVICVAIFLFIGLGFGYWGRAAVISFVGAIFYIIRVGRRRLSQLAFAIYFLSALAWIDVLPVPKEWAPALRSVVAQFYSGRMEPGLSR